MGIIILLSIFIIAVVMTVKEIKEGMTAPEVAQTIKENFDALNTEKETVGNVGKVKESVDNANKNTGVNNYPAFSATEDVAVGVVRNYNGLLYRSIVAGANEWNEANWERVSLESLQNEKLTELASDVKSVSVKMKDGYLVTSGSTVDITDIRQGNNYKYAIIPCSEGDIIKLINTIAATNPRAWCFCDSNNNVLSVSYPEAAISDEKLIAPIGSSYCVVNDKNNGAVSYLSTQSLEQKKTREIDFIADKKSLGINYPTISLTKGIYADDGSIGTSNIRVYCKINAKNYRYINVVVPGFYRLAVKYCTSDWRVVETTSWVMGENTIETNGYDNIVIILGKFEGTEFNDTEISTLNKYLNINLSFDTPLYSLVLNKTEELSNKIRLLSDYSFDINGAAVSGTVSTGGSITADSTKASIKIEGLISNNKYISYIVPNGYRAKCIYYNNDWTSPYSTDWNTGVVSKNIRSFPKVVLWVSKINGSQNITNSELSLLDLHIKIYNYTPDVISISPNKYLGYSNNDGSIDSSVTYRGTIRIPNTYNYSKLNCVVPEGYYVTIKKCNYGWNIISEGTDWLTGSITVDVEGTTNILLNLGKGSSYNTNMTLSEIDRLDFNITGEKDAQAVNIKQWQEEANISKMNYFDFPQFLLDNWNKIESVENGYYRSTSTIAYNIKMKRGNTRPLLLEINGYTSSYVTISAKFCERECINDYIIKNKYCQTIQILLPPFVYMKGGNMTIFLGSDLYFNDIRLTEYRKPKANNGIIFAGHLGAALGFNNIPSFQMAANLGMDGLVANILTTQDGVLVCSHNDVFTATSDGNSYRLSQKTYDEINTLGWYDTSGGRTKMWCDLYNGFKLPTISDFLSICKNLNMTPFLSIDTLNAPNWTALNNLFVKYGFTNKKSIYLKFKTDSGDRIYGSIISEANTMIGDKAVYITSRGDNTQENLNSIIALDLGTSKKGFESMAPISDSLIELAKSNDIEVCVYESILEQESAEHPYQNSDNIKSYIDKGVAIFTTDGFYSNGLNWM